MGKLSQWQLKKSNFIWQDQIVAHAPLGKWHAFVQSIQCLVAAQLELLALVRGWLIFVGNSDIVQPLYILLGQLIHCLAYQAAKLVVVELYHYLILTEACTAYSSNEAVHAI